MAFGSRFPALHEKGTDRHSTQHSKSVLMKLICVGRNYAKHIEELQNDRPDAPVIL